MLLLSFLLDDLNKDASKKLWNILHDFYITEEAMDMIRAQSEKLARHLHSLETWENSNYAKILRIIDEETLTSLRDFLTKYAFASPNRAQFKAAVKKIYRQYYKDVQGFVSKIIRSIGCRLTHHCQSSHTEILGIRRCGYRRSALCHDGQPTVRLLIYRR